MAATQRVHVLLNVLVYFVLPSKEAILVYGDSPYQNPDENVALSASELLTFEIDLESSLVGSTLER